MRKEGEERLRQLVRGCSSLFSLEALMTSLPTHPSFRLLALLTTHAHLGDPRRNSRLLSLLSHFLASPSASLSSLAGSDSKYDIKAAQRFLSNPLVLISSLREILYKTTWDEANKQSLSYIVIAHDPTLLDFSFQNTKQNRMNIGDQRGLGYTWLNGAAIDPTSGAFLGVVQQTLVSSEGPDDKDLLNYMNGTEYDDEVTKEDLVFSAQQQFLTHVKSISERAPKNLELIHVADREFDDGLALRECNSISTDKNHFVIRGNGTRVVQVKKESWMRRRSKVPSEQKNLKNSNDPILTSYYLKDLIKFAPYKIYGKILLDSRGRVCVGEQKIAKESELLFAAFSIRLAKQSKRAIRNKIKEEPIWLNLVIVKEKTKKNKKGIEWLLLTDMKIGTEEDIRKIVRCYSYRWRIEEFFRTVKDAMKIEESKLGDETSTARLLFFVTAKAMFIDGVRREAEIASGKPPSQEQRKSLEDGAKKAKEIEKQSQEPEFKEPKLTRKERGVMILGLLARLGRWAGRSGDHLGNYVLLRGMILFLHDVSQGRYAWLVGLVGS